jgi:citrate lyase subunit beta/citryl-CoA lyase
MVNGGLRAGFDLKGGGAPQTCLILPADAPDAGAAAIGSGATAALLRLAGGGEAARARSRANAAAHIKDLRKTPSAPAVFVEIAPLGEPAAAADLDGLVAAAPDGVFLPFCASRAELQRLSVSLAVREAAAGIAEGAVRIVAWAAQTPDAVMSLTGLAHASPRLAGLAFDARALGAALGVPADSPTIGVARAQLVLAAAAAKVPALELAPAGNVARAAAQAKRAGFAGMILRAPEHVLIVASVYCGAG